MWIINYFFGYPFEFLILLSIYFFVLNLCFCVLWCFEIVLRGELLGYYVLNFFF